MAIGIDVGTYNLITAKRGEKENEVKYVKEVNAFLELGLESRYTFNMLKNSGVKLLERENAAFIVGETALEMARSLRKELKRPMKDGCLNSAEKESFRILMTMIHSIIGEAKVDKEIVFYSVPANAINEKTDADYHQKVLEEMLKKYKVNGKIITPYAINEGLALVFAELGKKNYTGIGMSFGAGMVNVCYSIFSQPILSFAIVGSGDWIDAQAAHATNESIAHINREKHKIDLTKAPQNMVERAIQSQYRIMIEKTVLGMKKAIIDAGNAVRSDDPVDIILGGGTASPVGFEKIVEEVIKESGFPIKIGSIKKPEDHLHAVARGCLIAAENAQ